jgi:hypothetical protein
LLQGEKKKPEMVTEQQEEFDVTLPVYTQKKVEQKLIAPIS